ncbi:unnamed protein product [Dimorphilus gyrociliatus]|uniref:Uncharacterized protein n=1 Tax=Dimorphilus gyrociliatus TaxID=2664684 RepID=A0A7I8W840_9ANNE|nr:unnamed protein product [Dimorphilus gyrociliatus]
MPCIRKRFIARLRKYFIWIAAAIYISILLFIYLTTAQNDQRTIRDTQEIEAGIKRLRKLQRTMFINPKRPDDSVYNINITLSEQIALDREIPDVRPEGCSSMRYDISKMPKTSVVIIFYNEALSMILRTVHSVLNRSHKSLLEEVILVDDASTNEDLRTYLRPYISNLPKVKLLTNKKRLGLIKARLLGFHNAVGEFVFFQDAHTEANVQWLEPLLNEILKNPRTVIQPYVDEIDTKTLEYRGSTGRVSRGGFSWDLRYTWTDIPDHEWNRVTRLANEENIPPISYPFRSATLVGCAFGVLKKYFIHLGTFDEDFKIWGGENIELAWRTWQCHGQVLTHPCSRVAHTFKPFAYKFDGDREKIVQKNLIRTAATWMDDYAKYFYAITYAWVSKRTYLTDDEKKTLQKRKDLRKRLQCKSFEWYLVNIAPEVNIPPADAIHGGEIFNTKTESCWHVRSSGYIGITTECFFHRTVPENEFFMKPSRHVYIGDKVLRVDKGSWLLYISDKEPSSDNDEIWSMEHDGYYTGKIVVNYSHLGKARKACATQVTNVHKIHQMEQMVQMTDCSDTDRFQNWRWTYKFNWNYKFDKDHAQPERDE